MDRGRRKHYRRVEKHGRKACTSQNTDAAAGCIRTKIVWKVDFRVIQAIIKQKNPNIFIAFKNICVTVALLMRIGPINNVVNSYYVFLLFSPRRQEYTAECFKIKTHMHITHSAGYLC